MTPLRNRASMLFLLAGMAIAAGAGAIVAARAVPSRPAVVGIVDLEYVFNKSNLWANAQAGLKELDVQLEEEFTARKATLEQLNEELSNFQPGSPAQLKLQPEINEAISEFKAFEQWMRLRRESAKSRALRETYETIRTAAKTFAQANQVDIVLIDDSIPEMTRGNTASTVQQISARRVLFATSDFNITKDLLAELNAANPLKPGVTLSDDASSATAPAPSTP